MSDAALSISFVDPARGLHGTARSGMTLLFEGTGASSHAEGPVIEQRADGWHAELDGRLALDFTPFAPATELAGTRSTFCTVTGSACGQEIDGLGVVAELLSPPRWEDLDASRTLHALFDPEHAVLVQARRPRGAHGHGEELITAQLLYAGEMLAVDDARVSTIYDGEGRPRTAGLELWLPGEDFPRRAFGHVSAGASLALDGLDVHAGLFTWRMDTLDGAGIYELTLRQPAPTAA